MSQTTFEQLGLPADLVAALAAQRITEPFAIQDLTLPDAIAGRDILGRAPTGSGKTLAFGLPALARLGGTDKAIKRRPRGLILSPTRELAEQIQRELAPLATSVRRQVAAVYGGAAVGPQIRALSKGVDLLVACPGRLLDLIDQGEVALSDVEIAIVDEADRMADMGFLPDVRRILDMTADDRQTLLFSATLDGDVKTLTDRYQHDPAQHEIGDPEPDLSTMEHRFLKIPRPDRMGHAADVITEHGSTVVFVRTRHGVDRLARQLKQRGVKAGYIHGGRSQSQRSRALALFTDGKVDALVATDVAARGIHVDGVACVLHYDPPADTKDYVHRSGRTARAGAGGVVISFLDPSQVKDANKMQRQLSIDVDIVTPDAATVRPIVEQRPQKSSGRKPGQKSNRKPKSSSRHQQNGSSESSNRSERSSRSERPKRDERSDRPAGAGKPKQGSKPGAKHNSKPGASSGAKQGAKPGSKRGGATGGGQKRNGAKAGAAGKGPGGRATKRSGRPRPANRKGKPRSRRSAS